MASLGARLVAMSGEVEEKPENGVWLTEQMKEFKLREGITEDTVPTRELIKLQVSLPKFGTKKELEKFKDPILSWVPITGEKKLPRWDKKNLPEEEEEVKEIPPPMDRKEFGIGKWLQPAPTIVKEEILNNNREIKIPKKEEVLNNNDVDDNMVVTVLDSSCVIRYVPTNFFLTSLKKQK